MVGLSTQSFKTCPLMGGVNCGSIGDAGWRLERQGGNKLLGRHVDAGPQGEGAFGLVGQGR